MAKHTCPRCGFESARDRWYDRHPFAAVLFALPAGYTVVGVILAYPWFFVPLVVVAAVVWLDRRQRRRAAIAARAEWEYRESIARAVFGPPPSPLRPVRRRGADHWSPTQPVREVKLS